MTTASEEITARYTTVEKEGDAFGRLICVKRIKGSQRLRVLGMTSDLAEATQPMPNQEWKEGDPQDKQLVHVPIQSLMVIAASVCEIDGVPIPPAKNRPELDAIYDRLDDEGLAAAAVALHRLSAPAESENGSEGEVAESAKK